MKVLMLLSLLEGHIGKVILDITIHASKMRGLFMEESAYNSPSLYLVSMGGENILFLRCHGIFDTGAVFQGQQKVVA